MAQLAGDGKWKSSVLLCIQGHTEQADVLLTAKETDQTQNEAANTSDLSSQVGGRRADMMVGSFTNK